MGQRADLHKLAPQRYRLAPHLAELAPERKPCVVWTSSNRLAPRRPSSAR